jgi:hypothetical protein
VPRWAFAEARRPRGGHQQQIVGSGPLASLQRDPAPGAEPGALWAYQSRTCGIARDSGIQLGRRGPASRRRLRRPGRRGRRRAPGPKSDFVTLPRRGVILGQHPRNHDQITRLLAAAGILAAAAATASAKVERVVEKTFLVDPGVHLRVSTSGGEIRVDPWPATVQVTAREHIRASSEADADLVLKNLDLVIEQHGNDVVATASYRTRRQFSFRQLAARRGRLHRDRAPQRLGRT